MILVIVFLAVMAFLTVFQFVNGTGFFFILYDIISSLGIAAYLGLWIVASNGLIMESCPIQGGGAELTPLIGVK